MKGHKTMKTKRILALVLSLLMVLALGATAVFAAEGDTEETPVTPTTPSLTIENALKGNSYAVYKIFNLDSYDVEAHHYVYSIQSTDPLYNAVKAMQYKGNNVFTLIKGNDTTYYVELSTSMGTVGDDSEATRDIARQLMEEINKWNDDPANADKPISYVQKIDHLGEGANEERLPIDQSGNIIATEVAGEGNEDKFNVTFSNIGFGYFLVDTSAGTMFSVDTTNPTATIEAKNQLPKVVKEVRRNYDGNWAERNTKCIGEKVEFRVRIEVMPGATNYKLYDIISSGLDFGSITKVYFAQDIVKDAKYVVYDSDPASGKSDLSAAPFTYEIENVTHNDQVCCFKMTFKDEFLKEVLGTTGSGLTQTIFVEYYGYVNADAIIAGEGNPNEAHMTYGANNVEVTKSTTNTFVYEVEVVKTDNKNVILENAVFNLYNTKDKDGTLTEQFSFVETTDAATGKKVYRVATAEEIANPDIETVSDITAGDMIIRGLGGNFTSSANARTYYLEETEAPNGYNRLANPVEIKLTDASKLAEVDTEAKKFISGNYKVENKTGSLLPSTGGIGTTLFYVIGGLLVAGAVVMLVTRRRVSDVEDAQK